MNVHIILINIIYMFLMTSETISNCRRTITNNTPLGRCELVDFPKNNYDSVIINRENINAIHNYGYMINDKWNNSKIKISYDDEFPICMKTLIMLNYEIHIKHNNLAIVDPVIICNGSKTFSLYRSKYHHQSHDIEYNNVFTIYKLITDKYILKTKHIQKIPETILMDAPIFCRYSDLPTTTIVELTEQIKQKINDRAKL
jgi:hypothetical protein